MTDLARQLAAHLRWRWEPGMCVTVRMPHSDLHGASDIFLRMAMRDGDGRPWIMTGKGLMLLPGNGHQGATIDIHHPATRGWLLHMLREATGIVDACALSDGETWDAGPTSAALRNEFGEPLWAGHATEGDALAAALLAAWGAP